MTGWLLSHLLWAGAVLGGLSAFGGGVLLVVLILVAACASLVPLLWLPIDECAEGPDAEPRELLTSL